MAESFQTTEDKCTRMKHDVPDHEYTGTSYSAEECRDLFINQHEKHISGSFSNGEQSHNRGDLSLTRLQTVKRRRVKVPKQYEDFILSSNVRSNVPRNIKANKSVKMTSKEIHFRSKHTTNCYDSQFLQDDKVTSRTSHGQFFRVAKCKSKSEVDISTIFSRQGGKPDKIQQSLKKSAKDDSETKLVKENHHVTELMPAIKHKVKDIVECADDKAICDDQVHDDDDNDDDVNIYKIDQELILVKKNIQSDVITGGRILQDKHCGLIKIDVGTQCSNELIDDKTYEAKVGNASNSGCNAGNNNNNNNPNVTTYITKNKILGSEIVPDDTTLCDSSKSVFDIVHRTPTPPNKCSKINGITSRKAHKSVIKTVQKMTQTTLCSQCGKHLSTLSSYQNHLLIHADEKPFCCETCGVVFRASVNFQRHCKTHLAKRPFKCDSCNWEFSQKRLYDQHRLKHHGPDSDVSKRAHPVKIGKTACKFCGKVIQSYSRLQIHLRSHTGEKAYFCKICSRGFNVGCNYRRHMLRHGERTFQCTLCKKSYFEKRHLETHIQRLHSAVIKQENTTYTGAMMKAASVAVNAKYICPYCPKRYVLKEALNRHLKHNYIKCTICTKICKNQTEYTNHQLVHTIDRPFICKVCNKGFKSEKSLILHGLCHTNNMPHVCKVCGKKFRHPQGIWRHMKYHQTEKPHKCSHCSKGFCHKPDLKRHMRSHENQAHRYDTWMCGKCDASFSDLQKFLRHECKVMEDVCTSEVQGANTGGLSDPTVLVSSNVDEEKHIKPVASCLSSDQHVAVVENHSPQESNLELKQEEFISNNPAGCDEGVQSETGVIAELPLDMLRQLEMLSESGQYQQIMLLDADTNSQYLIVAPDTLTMMDTAESQPGVAKTDASIQNVKSETVAETSVIESVSESVKNKLMKEETELTSSIVCSDLTSDTSHEEILIASPVDQVNAETKILPFPDHCLKESNSGILQYGHSLLTGKIVLLNPVMETNSRTSIAGADKSENI